MPHHNHNRRNKKGRKTKNSNPVVPPNPNVELTNGFRKWADALWPLGGTVLALIAVPILIEQYPEFLKENKWVLPISVVVVIFCWILPIFRHNRTVALYQLAINGGWLRKVFVLALVLAIGYGMAKGGIKIFRFHTEHLARVLAAKSSLIQVTTLPPPPDRAYDITKDKAKLFFDIVGRKQKGKKDLLRVGCTEWSESSCIAAGKFLVLFSQAGWTIEGKQVFREQPEVPVEGVSLIRKLNKGELTKKEKLPPHLGIWKKMDESEITIYAAFGQIHVPVDSGNDQSLPKGELGIYFGPEPIPH